jgi:DNA-binding NarL/FixJ family response regulator
MQPISVLLVDDHETVREGVKAILAGDPSITVVAEAADGESATKCARELRPDVVIMDLTMPRQNGLQATEAIKQLLPRTHVLVLTRHADHTYVQQLLQAGASGYVLKQSRARELLNAVRTVARGERYLDPAATGVVFDSLVRGSKAGGVSDTVVTRREEEVLRLIASGYSNKEIASQLQLSVKTVETHKANAAQKLGFHSRSDIVRLALLRGWLKDT